VEFSIDRSIFDQRSNGRVSVLNKRLEVLAGMLEMLKDQVARLVVTAVISDASRV
jgi:uncharacterized Rmd1/YagE family protein